MKWAIVVSLLACSGCDGRKGTAGGMLSSLGESVARADDKNKVGPAGFFNLVDANNVVLGKFMSFDNQAQRATWIDQNNVVWVLNYAGPAYFYDQAVFYTTTDCTGQGYEGGMPQFANLGFLHGTFGAYKTSGQRVVVQVQSLQFDDGSCSLYGPGSFPLAPVTPIGAAPALPALPLAIVAGS